MARVLGLAGVVLVGWASMVHGAEAAGPPEVLYVGGESGASTVPFLRRDMRALRLRARTIKGADSRRLAQLAAVSDRNPAVVIFDGGNDDDEPLDIQGNLYAVAEAHRQACMVVPTVLTASDEKTESENKGIYEFAEANPSTQVVEWFGATKVRPEFLRPEAPLPTRAGARFRAKLLSEAVRECFSESAGWVRASKHSGGSVEIPTLTLAGSAMNRIYVRAAAIAAREAVVVVLMRLLTG